MVHRQTTNSSFSARRSSSCQIKVIKRIREFSIWMTSSCLTIKKSPRHFKRITRTHSPLWNQSNLWNWVRSKTSPSFLKQMLESTKNWNLIRPMISFWKWLFIAMVSLLVILRTLMEMKTLRKGKNRSCIGSFSAKILIRETLWLPRFT